MLLRRFVLLTLIVASVGAAAYVTLPGDRTTYMAAIEDKERLLQSTPSPRIIFVGGSNLAFGLDSNLIRQRLGLPVVNMGLGAGVGLRFMLEQIKPQLRAGDIVVIVPEYEILQADSEFDGGVRTLAYTIGYAPQTIAYLRSPRQFYHLLLGLGAAIRNKLDLLHAPNPANRTEGRAAFDANGDFIGHLGKPQSSKIELQPLDPVKVANLVRDAIPVMNEFQHFAQSRDVTVYMTFPPHYGTISPDMSGMKPFFCQLKAQLDIPLLGTPDAYFFDASYMFDTVYHLTAEGRAIRTERVIQYLEQHMRVEKPPDAGLLSLTSSFGHKVYIPLVEMQEPTEDTSCP
jgi:hypothetical protein